MQVSLPVYLFDVVTAVDTPRCVVTCRTAEAAQLIAARLNAMRHDGSVDDDAFAVAEPRPATAMIEVATGRCLPLDGYVLDVSAIATAVDAQTGKAGRVAPDASMRAGTS